MILDNPNSIQATHYVFIICIVNPCGWHLSAEFSLNVQWHFRNEYAAIDITFKILSQFLVETEVRVDQLNSVRFKLELIRFDLTCLRQLCQRIIRIITQHGMNKNVEAETTHSHSHITKASKAAGTPNWVWERFALEKLQPRKKLQKPSLFGPTDDRGLLLLISLGEESTCRGPIRVLRFGVFPTFNLRGS